MGKVLVILVLLAACRAVDSGLAPTDAGPWDMVKIDTTLLDSPKQFPDTEISIQYGNSSLAGCADLTREGFIDATVYPDIAACSGAFQIPGIIGLDADRDEPTRCHRLAGNTANAAGTVITNGIDCTAADLCAIGWHVCRDAQDVARHNPNEQGCTGAMVYPGKDTRFFLVAMGASPQGLCTSDPSAVNDLHGCGGLGQPEDGSCAPLVSRMTFADCAKSTSWLCGNESDIGNEATVVTKWDSHQGGVLCCRDPHSVDAGFGLIL